MKVIADASYLNHLLDDGVDLLFTSSENSWLLTNTGELRLCDPALNGFAYTIKIAYQQIYRGVIDTTKNLYPVTDIPFHLLEWFSLSIQVSAPENWRPVSPQYTFELTPSTDTNTNTVREIAWPWVCEGNSLRFMSGLAGMACSKSELTDLYDKYATSRYIDDSLCNMVDFNRNLKEAPTHDKYNALHWAVSQEPRPTLVSESVFYRMTSNEDGVATIPWRFLVEGSDLVGNFQVLDQDGKNVVANSLGLLLDQRWDTQPNQYRNTLYWCQVHHKTRQLDNGLITTLAPNSTYILKFFRGYVLHRVLRRAMARLARCENADWQYFTPESLLQKIPSLPEQS